MAEAARLNSEVRGHRWSRAAALARSLLPRLDRRVLLLGAATLPLNAALAVIVQRKDQFDLGQALPWVHLADKVAFDFAFFVAGVGLLGALPRARLLPVLFVALYATIAGVDLFAYHCAHTVFEREYLAFAEAAYAGSFLGLHFALIVGVGVLAGVIGFLTLRRAQAALPPTAALRWALLAAALAAVELPQRFCQVRAALGSPPDSYQNDHDRLRYAAQNALLNFLDELLFRQPAEAHLLDELAPHRATIAAYGLPLGARAYPALDLGFERVVLFTIESLSLDTLHPYNQSLPAGVSPFYGSERVRSRMQLDHRTTQTPTLPAMLALFNSHPNAWMCCEAESPLSFVKVLAAHGWETVMVRGDPKRFAGEDVHYLQAGFRRDVAREDFDAAGADPHRTAEWGVTDRLLFDDVIERLRAARGRKVFVTVLSVDTHPWFGRVDYGGLDLPAPPATLEAIADTGVREWLRSVFLHDHEMGRFVGRLAAEGLWDERTLVILTADHSCPRNPVSDELPAYPRTSVARIPLALLTPARLPGLDRRMRSCQLDVGPTILHLLGLPVPAGYWGESLFAERRGHPAVSVFREVLTLDYGDRREVVDLDGDAPEQTAIRELYGSILLGRR